LKSVPHTALASEEADIADIGDPSAPIAIAYDPHDGSSNIETNMPVGDFSILPGSSGKAPFTGRRSDQL
jgi:fructose-1,6-bisphosphatase I